MASPSGHYSDDRYSRISRQNIGVHETRHDIPVLMRC
jgi:hypothetical protein